MIGKTIANISPTAWIRNPANPTIWKCYPKWATQNCFSDPGVEIQNYEEKSAGTIYLS